MQLQTTTSEFTIGKTHVMIVALNRVVSQLPQIVKILSGKTSEKSSDCRARRFERLTARQVRISKLPNRRNDGATYRRKEYLIEC